MKLCVSSVLMMLGLSVGLTAHADYGVAFFRYYDDHHQVHIVQEVSDEAVDYGYQELDHNMNILRTVPPRPTAKDMERIDAERRHQAELANQAQQDAMLKQLYSSPDDAIQLRINFSTRALTRLRQDRAAEAQRAAGFERNGQAVPKDTRDSIAKYDKDLIAAEADLKQRQQDQQNTRDRFGPIITRLQAIQAQRQAARASGLVP
jgi:hypothetical protein